MNLIGQEFSLIPSGTFMMGSSENDPDNFSDLECKKVIITKSFHMSDSTVTQKQWREVMNTEPWKDGSYVQCGDNYPAVYINWYDAVSFCKKLSDMDGVVYRLPTDAEWEYAFSGGKAEAFSFNYDENKLGQCSWYHGNTEVFGEDYAHCVKQKKPNENGLYDMIGNVWEWCSDQYQYATSVQNYEFFRGIRGGSWRLEPGDVYSGHRYAYNPKIRRSDIGFRVVME